MSSQILKGLGAFAKAIGAVFKRTITPPRTVEELRAELVGHKAVLTSLINSAAKADHTPAALLEACMKNIAQLQGSIAWSLAAAGQKMPDEELQEAAHDARKAECQRWADAIMELQFKELEVRYELAEFAARMRGF